MELSIIVINFNTYELTCACIESIYEHIKELSFEIILVDNNSVEVSADVFVQKFPHIILVKSPENVGFAKGNNLGISRAQGRFILLLNSDAVLLNDVGNILRAFLMQHSSVAAVSGRLQYPDGRVQHNCQRFPSIRAKLFELFRLQKIVPRRWSSRVLYGSFFEHNTVAFPDWIWGTCFMFPKRLLNRLPQGKLADQFFMYAEDVEWCIQFRKLGLRVAFEPRAQLVHLLGKSGGKSVALMDNNMNLLLNKYYSTAHRKLILLLDKLLYASIGRG